MKLKARILKGRCIRMLPRRDHLSTFLAFLPTLLFCYCQEQLLYWLKKPQVILWSVRSRSLCASQSEIDDWYPYLGFWQYVLLASHDDYDIGLRLLCGKLLSFHFLGNQRLMEVSHQTERHLTTKVNYNRQNSLNEKTQTVPACASKGETFHSDRNSPQKWQLLGPQKYF